MKLSIIMTKIHKWLALIIGIQLLLWVMGGLVMSWFPIENVRGEHNISEGESFVITVDDNLLSIADVLASIGAIKSIELKPLMGMPTYEVVTEDGITLILDASNGEVLSPLNEVLALQIASFDFSGQTGNISASMINEGNSEYRGNLPVWRVAMGDDEATRLYVSPETGDVIARRNGTWRLYDFFWMLHIMDYENRTNFNNPLVIIASIAALIASISGIWLIFYRFTRRDFRWFGLK
ncbi:MAG: PepSY domain-containing protein [Gammaproteobacteria bacterium]|jgi:hypothetical protein|nr:PepSY domain-containing protein [Gammaproteobacteria bacterium]